MNNMSKLRRNDDAECCAYILYQTVTLGCPKGYLAVLTHQRHSGQSKEYNVAGSQRLISTSFIRYTTQIFPFKKRDSAEAVALKSPKLIWNKDVRQR